MLTSSDYDLNAKALEIIRHDAASPALSKEEKQKRRKTQILKLKFDVKEEPTNEEYGSLHSREMAQISIAKEQERYALRLQHVIYTDFPRESSPSYIFGGVTIGAYHADTPLKVTEIEVLEPYRRLANSLYTEEHN